MCVMMSYVIEDSNRTVRLHNSLHNMPVTGAAENACLGHQCVHSVLNTYITRYNIYIVYTPSAYFFLFMT